MKSFDDVLERLTEKLKGDPELRAEVSNELRGHLEESAREFGAAGRNEEEARGEAVRAMGDEREVAEGLWEGNRRRMVRRRVGRWVVGGGLLTAAGVGTVAVAWGAVVSVAAVLALVAGVQQSTAGAFGGPLAQRVAEYARAGRVGEMSARGRAIFDASEGTAAERAERARALAEGATGEDRKVFWAYYATQLLVLADIGRGDPAKLDRAAVARAVGAMEEGRRIEPGNGYYPLMEAALLLASSAKYIDEPEERQPGYQSVGPKGEVEWTRFDRWEVTDPATFARGMARYREAAAAPYIDSHALDFSRRRIEALPAATRLADEAIRVREDIAVLLPFLNYYRMTMNIAGAHAIELARAGKVDEALGIVRDGRAVARGVAARSRSLIELLVASGMYAQSLSQEAMVAHVAGDRGWFERAVAALDEYGRGQRGLRNADWQAVAQLKRESGVMGGRFLPTGIDPAAVDPAPERRAEYAVADQLAVVAWAAVLVMAGVWMVAGAAWRRVRAGRWPGVMFVGWGRVAWVVAVAVGGPVGAYALYAWVVGGRGLNVGVGTDRLAVEYAVVGSAVVILLRVLGERAMRRRAKEIGETWDEAAWGKARVVAGGVLAAAVVAYLVAWHVMASDVTVMDAPTGWWGFVLAAVVAGYGMSWLRGIGDGVGGTRMPRWVGPAAVTALMVVAVFVFGGSYGYRTGRVVAEYAGAVFGAAVVLAAVAVMGAMAVRRRGEREEGRIARGLSMGPMVLGAAVALVAVVGGAARVAERREVRRMEAGGGIVRMDREVEMSKWRGMRDRIVKGDAGGGEGQGA